MTRHAPILPALILATLLAGSPALGAPKHLSPVPAATLSLMQAKGIAVNAPILIRAFKRESEMEVWRQDKGGRYVLVKTFPICRWSGQLGPKRSQGDRQTPEGFYGVSQAQMRPTSAYYLAFDTGFPNAYDKANRASGSALMVHGTCSSSGCFAMTDKGIEEIYALARDAFSGTQKSFQFQSFPFRMTAENLVRYRNDRNVAFWGQLKEGYDRFEATGEEPTVATTGGRYVFLPYQDRAKEEAVIALLNQQVMRVAALLSQGTPAFRISYVDGGQHPSFAAEARLGTALGDVSRPEALASAGTESMVPGSQARQAVRSPVLRQLPPPMPVVVASQPVPTDLLPDVLRQALALSAVPAQPLRPPGAAPVVPPAPATEMPPVMAQALTGSQFGGADRGALATAALAGMSAAPAPAPVPEPPKPVRRF